MRQHVDAACGVVARGVVEVAANVSRIGITRVDGGETHDPETPPIAQPKHEGDDRPLLGQSTLQALLNLPHEWLNLARVILDTRNVLVDALAREVWANSAPISNQAQDGTINAGTNAYICAFKGHPSEAIELRDCLIGAGAAATITIVAARASSLIGSNPPYRQIGTIRITANCLSNWFPPVIRLEPEENLFLIASTATGNFDLSAQYRVLKG